MKQLLTLQHDKHGATLRLELNSGESVSRRITEEHNAIDVANLLQSMAGEIRNRCVPTQRKK